VGNAGEGRTGIDTTKKGEGAAWERTGVGTGEGGAGWLNGRRASVDKLNFLKNVAPRREKEWPSGETQRTVCGHKGLRLGGERGEVRNQFQRANSQKNLFVWGGGTRKKSVSCRSPRRTTRHERQNTNLKDVAARRDPDKIPDGFKGPKMGKLSKKRTKIGGKKGTKGRNQSTRAGRGGNEEC